MIRLGRAHIADAGFLGLRAQRIEARGVDRDDIFVGAQRVENFRHCAADRDDPAGVGGLRAGGDNDDRRAEEMTQSATKHLWTHLVRISLFCAVSRRR
jgi:hypothetical protein